MPKKPLISVELTAFCPLCHKTLTDKQSSIQLVTTPKHKSTQLSCTDDLCKYTYPIDDFKEHARSIMLSIKKEDQNARCNEHEEVDTAGEETAH